MQRSRLACTLGLLFASTLLWGLGNAFTGYSSSLGTLQDPIARALSVAFANTLGGLIGLLALSRAIDRRRSFGTLRLRITNRDSIFSAGVAKAANTFLFVLTTTMVSTASAVVLESTYILWAVWMHRDSMRFGRTAIVAMLTASLLMVGVCLVCLPDARVPSGASLGVALGIAAGGAYAVFLRQWARSDGMSSNLPDQIDQTLSMLLWSFLTLTTASSLALGVRWLYTRQAPSFMPPGHFAFQVLNGVAVLGIVYLLMKVAFGRLEGLSPGKEVLAAFSLSFSVPITSLTEALLKHNGLDVVRLGGICFFLVSFPLLVSLTVERSDHIP